MCKVKMKIIVKKKKYNVSDRLYYVWDAIFLYVSNTRNAYDYDVGRSVDALMVIH